MVLFPVTETDFSYNYYIKIATKLHPIFHRQADVHVFWTVYYDSVVIGLSSMINLERNTDEQSYLLQPPTTVGQAMLSVDPFKRKAFLYEHLHHSWERHSPLMSYSCYWKIFLEQIVSFPAKVNNCTVSPWSPADLRWPACLIFRYISKGPCFLLLLCHTCKGLRERITVIMESIYILCRP